MNNTIQKSFENLFEKGGKGSGRKIGTTESGKDVYDEPDHEAHKNFTKQDHKDASSIHAHKIVKLMGSANKRQKQGDDKDFSAKLQKHTIGQGVHSIKADQA